MRRESKRCRLRLHRPNCFKSEAEIGKNLEHPKSQRATPRQKTFPRYGTRSIASGGDLRVRRSGAAQRAIAGSSIAGAASASDSGHAICCATAIDAIDTSHCARRRLDESRGRPANVRRCFRKAKQIGAAAVGRSD
jgi:hypothetical protein